MDTRQEDAHKTLSLSLSTAVTNPESNSKPLSLILKQRPRDSGLQGRTILTVVISCVLILRDTNYYVNNETNTELPN
jgi:hypothetical protein